MFKKNKDKEIKPLDITSNKEAKAKISDLKLWGHGDAWKLIYKASSESQGWMKSTKALTCGSGVIVQVTTKETDKNGSVSLAEAIEYIPNVSIFDIIEYPDGSLDEVRSDYEVTMEHKIIGRRIK